MNDQDFLSFALDQYRWGLEESERLSGRCGIVLAALPALAGAVGLLYRSARVDATLSGPLWQLLTVAIYMCCITAICCVVACAACVLTTLYPRRVDTVALVRGWIEWRANYRRELEAARVDVVKAVDGATGAALLDMIADAEHRNRATNQARWRWFRCGMRFLVWGFGAATLAMIVWAVAAIAAGK
jgi:hypothetical protein